MLALLTICTRIGVSSPSSARKPCGKNRKYCKWNQSGGLFQNKHTVFNSLAPEKLELNFRHVIFKQILVIDGWGISCKIALIWMWLDFTDDQSTLVQVMAGAVRHQTITWANVDPDLCRHMASLGHNELILLCIGTCIPIAKMNCSWDWLIFAMGIHLLMRMTQTDHTAILFSTLAALMILNKYDMEQVWRYCTKYLGKSCSSHLHSAFIRCVNLEVVSERAVQSEKTESWRLAIVTCENEKKGPLKYFISKTIWWTYVINSHLHCIKNVKFQMLTSRVNNMHAEAQGLVLLRYRIFPWNSACKQKSGEISFAHNIFLRFPKVLKFCTEHGSWHCHALSNNFKTIGQMKWMHGQMRFHESLGRVSEGYLIPKQPLVKSQLYQLNWYKDFGSKWPCTVRCQDTYRQS